MTMAITTYTGSIQSSLGSALSDVENFLEPRTGTITTADVALVGPGKYFQGYVVMEE